MRRFQWCMAHDMRAPTTFTVPQKHRVWDPSRHIIESFIRYIRFRFIIPDTAFFSDFFSFCLYFSIQNAQFDNLSQFASSSKFAEIHAEIKHASEFKNRRWVTLCRLLFWICFATVTEHIPNLLYAYPPNHINKFLNVGKCHFTSD